MVVAGPLGLLEPLRGRIGAAVVVLAHHQAVAGRVGHVDAVLTHAAGEGDHGVALLGVDLAGPVAAAAHEAAAGLLGLVQLLGVRAGAAAAGAADPHPDPALVVDLRVGDVDAVLAHALGEVEGRLLGVLGGGLRGAAGRGGGAAA